jgi:hypothetical protein
VAERPAPHGRLAADGQVLLLSMREVAALVGYCAMYEFEDVAADLVGAEIVCPSNLEGLELSRKIYKVARHATGSVRVADFLRPQLGRLRLEKDYQLFVAVFNHPHELFALKALPDWRQRCQTAVCYICEAWEQTLPDYLLELLEDFDHVFLGVSGATRALARVSGRPCSYLPMGVDALRFCPYPAAPGRSIDVCGIGRRSPVTHAALLQRAQGGAFFYYYDTIESKPFGGSGKQVTFRVGNAREHRLLLASLLKRSRYFIANSAWVDDAALRRGGDEIASRFYEGAAAGTVMLGEAPDSPAFRSQFDWPDALVAAPFHAPELPELIATLDADPARVAGIRRENVANALLRHDWGRRLQSLMEGVGWAPGERMLAREARLSELARQVRASASGGG